VVAEDVLGGGFGQESARICMTYPPIATKINATSAMENCPRFPSLMNGERVSETGYFRLLPCACMLLASLLLVTELLYLALWIIRGMGTESRAEGSLGIFYRVGGSPVSPGMSGVIPVTTGSPISSVSSYDDKQYDHDY
jgi:hypothetical protein